MIADERERTLLVLGAGPLQVPLIEAARRSGLRVVALDNVAGNVGHRVADASVHASTRDIAAVVAAARAHLVTGISTAASDVAIPALAAACAELGLPGPSRETCAAFHGKDAFRDFQRAAGLAHPEFVVGDDCDALARDARTLEGPLFVKPTDRSGSRGVTRLDSAGAPELRQAVERALAASFGGRVCIEQALDGVEFGGDAIVHEGRIVFLAVTRKQMDGAIVRGHVFPSGLPDSLLAAIRAELDRHVVAAHYVAGALNFDLMLGPGGCPRVIELSPRLGGNWIPQLVAHACGVDLFQCAVDLALRRAPRLEPRATRPAATFVLGSKRASRLARPLTFAAARARLPQLVALEMDVEVDAAIAPFCDSGQQLGRALFALAGTTFRESAAALDEALVACFAREPG